MTIQNQKRVRAFRSIRDSSDGVSESALQVNVIFTTVEETLAALRRAGQLAHGLRATIQVLVAQVVPYPLPLESPPVAAEFTARKFHTMVDGESVATRVNIIFCRDKDAALQDTLADGSLVVIGG